MSQHGPQASSAQQIPAAYISCTSADDEKRDARETVTLSVAHDHQLFPVLRSTCMDVLHCRIRIIIIIA